MRRMLTWYCVQYNSTHQSSYVFKALTSSTTRYSNELPLASLRRIMRSAGFEPPAARASAGVMNLPSCRNESALYLLMSADIEDGMTMMGFTALCAPLPPLLPLEADVARGRFLPATLLSEAPLEVLAPLPPTSPVTLAKIPYNLSFNVCKPHATRPHKYNTPALQRVQARTRMVRCGHR